MVCLVPAGLVRSRDVLRSQPLGRSRYAPGDALRSRCATLRVPNTAASAVRCTHQWLHSEIYHFHILQTFNQSHPYKIIEL
jgi:hypothetical protein